MKTALAEGPDGGSDTIILLATKVELDMLLQGVKSLGRLRMTHGELSLVSRLCVSLDIAKQEAAHAAAEDAANGVCRREPLLGALRGGRPYPPPPAKNS